MCTPLLTVVRAAVRSAAPRPVALRNASTPIAALPRFACRVIVRGTSCCCYMSESFCPTLSAAVSRSRVHTSATRGHSDPSDTAGRLRLERLADALRNPSHGPGPRLYGRTMACLASAEAPIRLIITRERPHFARQARHHIWQDHAVCANLVRRAQDNDSKFCHRLEPLPSHDRRTLPAWARALAGAAAGRAGTAETRTFQRAQQCIDHIYIVRRPLASDDAEPRIRAVALASGCATPVRPG